MHLIDRPVAAIGGKDLVAGRPGIGWLVVEVTPAFIWTMITGAMSGEFFYFVAYLTLLGATATTLAWLPMTVALAGVVQAGVVLWRRPADPKRACVVDCLVGRCLWLGTLLWPLLAMWLGLGTDAILTGVFVSVFLSVTVCMVSVSAFVSWTQALVPRELRGVLYAWRNLSSYLVLSLVLFGVYHFTHRCFGHGHDLPWMMLLLGTVTVVGIIGVWPLALAPDASHEDRVSEHRPLLPQLRASGALQRHLAWMVATYIAGTLNSAYIPELFLDSGVDAETMAWCQAYMLYPAMVVGILAAGWALPRLHGRVVLVHGHCFMLGSEALLLLLRKDSHGWMLPLVLGLSGFAKGIWSIAFISRLQEIVPRRDPRVTGVFMGIASLGSLAVCAGMPAGVAALDGWCQRHPGSASVAWWMVAAAVGVRVLATPLLLWSDRVASTPAATARAA